MQIDLKLELFPCMENEAFYYVISTQWIPVYFFRITK